LSIIWEDGSFSLYCDICGEKEEGHFREFMDAVYYKNENGWRSQMTSVEWEDVCPDCQ
jgi:hypothetical protein